MGFMIGQKVLRESRGRHGISWNPCTVIEVVAAGDTPTRAGDWSSFSPRNHESYVVEEGGYWAYPGHPAKTFWPRVKWLKEEDK